MFRPPYWIKKEIDLLFPKAYPKWMSKYGKWFIVRDYYKNQPGVTEYVQSEGRHYIVVKVLEENDKPSRLNARTLKALKLLKYEGTRNENLTTAFTEVDRRQEIRAAKAAAYARDGRANFYKWAGHLKAKRTFS